MVKFNTPEEQRAEDMGNCLGVFLCGLVMGLCGATLGIGVGLLISGWITAVGLGLIGFAIGGFVGLAGGARVVQDKQK